MISGRRSKCWRNIPEVPSQFLYSLDVLGHISPNNAACTIASTVQRSASAVLNRAACTDISFSRSGFSTRGSALSADEKLLMEITHASEPPPRLEGGGAYFYGDIWAFLNDALPPDTVGSRAKPSTPNSQPQTPQPQTTLADRCATASKSSGSMTPPLRSRP